MACLPSVQGPGHIPYSYTLLHPKNPYYKQPPNLAELLTIYPDLAPYVHLQPSAKHAKVDWTNPKALQIITQTLLHHDFQIIWRAMNGYLCPPIPNRLNYLCYLSDLLTSSAPLYSQEHCHILDIGTGSNLIYPLLGSRLNNWRFSASDTNVEALHHAQQLLEHNPSLRHLIQLYHVESSDAIQNILVDNFFNDNSVVDKMGMHLLSLLCDHAENTLARKSQERSRQLIARRGPVRKLMAAMGGNFLSRVEDTEYYACQVARESSSLNSNSNIENTHSSCISTSRKKSRRQEAYDDDDDIDDDEEHTVSDNTKSTKYPYAYAPIISAIMMNPPFYDLSEEASNDIFCIDMLY
jgi:23S rRNA A1618 N6-methylase RlmF